MNAARRQRRDLQKSGKRIDIYLVIDSKQPVSRRLLVWMRQNREGIRLVLDRTKVIDVAQHAHPGVRQRVRHIPALIATNRPNTVISSIEDIKRILTLTGARSTRARRPVVGGGVDSDVSLRARRPAVGGGVDSHPSFSAMPPAAAQTGPFAYDRTSNFETVPPTASGRANSKSSWREKKMEGLESDLESLIAARKQLGGSRRRIH